ncbi:MAG: aromatic ring-hydroxylating dioxygenase subunit alpha [Armatimonadetes bacterium]|nr:aromatic ring-hydroxylating dioxygenase subunit alpha [Armatimonadota bacterium]
MPFGIDRDITRSSTLPSRFYTDPAIFEESKTRLFEPAWHWLGHSDVIKNPGQTYPFTLLEGMLDEPLVLTRDMEDCCHLLSNVCTHRGMLVCEGPGPDRQLRCRYHGRRFNLDGKFHSMPEFGGVENFPTEADNLKSLPLGNWGPFLFGSLSPSLSLEEFLKPMQERIGWLPLDEFIHSPAESRDYLVKAHWALYVDNYMEGFHIPYIHAALNQVLSFEDYVYEPFGHGLLQLGVAAAGEDSFDLPTTSPDYGKEIAAYYYWLFPNLMLNFYPWGLSVNVVKPLGMDVTKVSFIRYLWRPDRRQVGAGALLDRVEREDEAVVELVQKGIRSRFYDRGRFSPRHEVGTHYFHWLVNESFKIS